MDKIFDLFDAFITKVFRFLPFSREKAREKSSHTKCNVQILQHAGFYANFTAVEKVAKNSCRQNCVYQQAD
jgi:hypothetical protein